MLSHEDTVIRSLRARVAAHTRWANEPDRTAATAPAVHAFMSSFEKKVDPEGKLDAVTRAKMADSARKAHFSKLALASAQARKKKRAAKDAAARQRAARVR